MDTKRLITALATLLPRNLAEELVADFIKVRQDFSTKTLERSSPGKFVETVVQCLQHLSTGKFDRKPEVDKYLDKKLENETRIPEDLRVCAGRVARSIYTMRNRRNIAHKGQVDPNKRITKQSTNRYFRSRLSPLSGEGFFSDKISSV
ncbi:MAG: hypothetical protein K8F62_14840 [Pseudorhodoplanes sp.]|nr:hypothetical protein [Pseudorhodoplanes sp.]